MTPPHPPGAPSNLPPRRRVSVHAIERATPRVVCLRLRGVELSGFGIEAPGAHIKLILPPPGVARTPVPLRYEGRRAIFEDGVAPPFLRTYTPSRFDAARLELEVEMLIHGDGQASNWVQNAKVGDEIMVAGPRGGWDVPRDGDWYLVAADDTAIPAARQVLGALPPQPRFIFFEVVNELEQRPTGASPWPVSWLFRGHDAGRAGRLLEGHIRELTLPGGRGYVWIACEAGAVRRIRKHLIEDRGLDAGQLVTRGYWKLGVADHPDGDYGQDGLDHHGP